MSWPRKSLFLVLFFLSSTWGIADTITVNTTTDDYADNSLCSLREAVEYFNRNKPAAGFQGCTAPLSDAPAIISLPADKDPYVISAGSIPVRAAIIVSGAGARGDEKTVVEVQGAHRAFLVAFNPRYFAPVCSPSCAPASDPARPTLAAAPMLDPESDTDEVDEGGNDLTNDGAGDYLTFMATPELTGSIAPPPGNHRSDETYVVRIYQTVASGHQFLGEKKVTPDPAQLGAALPWSVRLNQALSPGMHYLTYTIERIKTAEGTVVQAESEHSLELTLAVYSRETRLKVGFSGFLLKGGKSACMAATVTCASDENGDYLINDPAAGAYDKYALTFQNVVTETAGNGGLIFSSENLALAELVLQDGEAKDVYPLDGQTTGKGGGIYLTADVTGAEVSGVEFKDNNAESGAAIFMASNGLTLVNSLVAGNVSSGGRSIVELGSATSAGAPKTLIMNSTFSGNTGVALSLRDNTAAGTASTVSVQDVTVVGNTGGGIDFNNSDVTVYNTIVAGNQDPAAPAGTYLDCLNTATAVVNYSLIVRNGSNTTCPAPTTSNNNVAISDTGSETLMTGPLDAEGRCHGATGILCPLNENGGSTRTHLPRLLPDYTSLDQSPLINKAGPGCPSTDQRTEKRDLVACDIGAVEVQSVAPNEPVKTGNVIKDGQVYEQYLGESLEDEELLPSVFCPAGYEYPAGSGIIYPPTKWADSATDLGRSRIVPNSYNRNEPGCPWREAEPPRGKVTYVRRDPVTGLDVSGQGYLRYTPDYAFHGFDTFSYRVVTTLSQLNPLLADRSRLVSTKVIVEPATEMVSDKLGGALDGWGVVLLGVFGLGWRSRRQA